MNQQDPMNVKIKLPDGGCKEYNQPINALRVAEEISPSLGRAAVAAEVDGKLVDLSAEIARGTHKLKLLTDDNDDPQALEVLRHTTAHVLAQAVVRLYGPKVQYTIGPALMDDFRYGFYYDFDLPSPVGSEDLEAIEAEMKRIAAEKTPLCRVELPADQARDRMTQTGQHYKAEMIDDLVAAEGAETISLYEQGGFVDMCRGPHLPHTGKLKAFKLLAVAGAYWRGDESNKMLTRIYGTAFFDKKRLAEHLQRIEEAKKRDHRLIGKQLGLFLVSDAVGPGLPLWMPKGTIIRMELEAWLRSELIRGGYEMVCTPHIGKLDLYRTSGHYPYYKESQFPLIPMGEGQGYLLKPMNCPHHIEIYRATQHSHRGLPVRLAEFGNVYRMEQSGELNGLIRVRGFTQDDAHIFCTLDQLGAEIESCVELTKLVLGTLGLNEYRVRIGLRGPNADKYVGQAANWNMAEQNIRNTVRKLNMNYVEESGEAAFYGPKIDFIVTDCIGREWQLGTIQVDYNLPERFGLEYIGPDNTAHRPIMIHRAPLGSLERFIGILIEHFAGAFPLWLAPVHVAVLPVSEKYSDYASGLVDQLRNASIRVELDDSPEKIGAKIRRAMLSKVLYMAVVGQREADAKAVAVRHRTEGDLGAMGVDAFRIAIREEIDTKGNRCVADTRKV
jgi:threonyl-tRNA synthetase